MKFRLFSRLMATALLTSCLISFSVGPMVPAVLAKPEKKSQKKVNAQKKGSVAPSSNDQKPTQTAKQAQSTPSKPVEPVKALAPTSAPTKSAGDQFLSVQSGEPVNISADSLSVNNESRTFTYTGGVVVTQGDLTLNCATLDGTYTTENQIDQLIAKTKVTITKGATITASGDRAIYDAKSRIITLTDNPQLQEGESTLSADVIKIFLDENRSVAEGQVRMKLIKATTPTPAAATNVVTGETPAPGVILSPSPTVSPTPAMLIQRLM